MAKGKVKSAKDILMSANFFEQRTKAQKYVKHEFQDYAYRLAADLGDLGHKHIYMKLAKSTPRYLLEQAAAFAKDYNEANKGRLFMWKLKQLREQIQLGQDNENFEYEFVLRRMGKLYDETISSLHKKYANLSADQELNGVISQLLKDLSSLTLPSRRRKHKILCLDSKLGYVPQMLVTEQMGLDNYEISKLAVGMCKERYPNLKFKRSVFKPNKAKQVYSAVWVGDFWKLVPLAYRRMFISGLYGSLMPEGIAVMRYTDGNSDAESWQEVVREGEPRFVYIKQEQKEDLLELLSTFEVIELPDNYLYIRNPS